MKKENKLITIMFTLLSGACTQTNAHPFSCGNLTRRFGLNSYLTRQPLFFKPVEKTKNKRIKEIKKAECTNSEKQWQSHCAKKYTLKKQSGTN